ncbi:MAG: alanine acetyltransferase [Flaviaesturariibacter sp.]|nr:alanine acetyltransferase [Flaviaesturariibacter sp.]
MLTPIFSPFPELHTERLRLRKMVEADAPDLFILRRSKDLMRFIPRPLAAETADAALLIQKANDAAEKGDAVNWGITLTGEDKVIGSIGYVRMNKENDRAEIGYLRHGDYHGKGIMQEAVAAVIDYGFDVLGLHSIEAIIHPGNKASAAVALKAGFTLSGSFKDYTFFDGRFIDADFYSLLVTDHR